MSGWRVGGVADRSPLIATGHQAWLWHPGILAKDIAMVVAAAPGAPGARTLHLVVDHDVHEAMQVALPIVEGGRLRVETLRLGETDAGVPTGCQPPVDRQELRRRVEAASQRRGLAASLDALRDAAGRLSDAPRSLAEQVGELTATLMRPWTGDVPFAYSSQLLRQIGAQAIVERVLGDARRCVRAYNRAVAAVPGAGVGRLIEERDRVELPLWQLGWGRPRRRVFADLADEPALLTYEDGTPIEELDRWLAPKALLLSAVMRTAICDLFIHGTGGGLYDEAMEHWWRGWLKEAPAAPRTVVSADVYLDLAAPVADRAELTRATWRRHHLPHNIDRLLPPAEGDRGLVERKRWLLAHMDDDRDRLRRRAAFRELQRVNRALAEGRPAAIREADEAVERARVGMANAAVARKRDWCFALYPPARLAELRSAIEAEATRAPAAAADGASGAS